MANVFVSHRKHDALLAAKLGHELTAAGHLVWFDEWEIGIGDSIVSRIDDGLEGSNYLVLCCSYSGMSDWVNREWMSALARQMSGHNLKVLPVLLSGGKLPAILADIKYANLVADWDFGVAELTRALR